VQYLVTDFWSREAERSLAWNDAQLAIEWPLPPGVSPLLSAKDAAAPPLAQVETFP
jgi:dTDP-4-dehydrorhamnose 3,5-epimerase